MHGARRARERWLFGGCCGLLGKRARSHGTKPSFDALFRCFQWRVYNAGRCADGEVAFHRTCACSFVSIGSLVCIYRATRVLASPRSARFLVSSRSPKVRLPFRRLSPTRCFLSLSASFGAFRFVKHTRENARARSFLQRERRNQPIDTGRSITSC